MEQQLTFDIEPEATYNRLDFFVLPENEHIVRMLENDSLWKSHCLILCGETGSGKTHLAHIFADLHKGLSFIMNAHDVKEETIPALVGKYKYIVLENAGEGVPEVNLFHLFNFAKDESVKLLITAEKSFTEWKLQRRDLYTRLATAMFLRIPEPSDEMMSVLLTKMFADKQIYVADEVFSYIITHTERSFKSVKSIVEAANELSLREKRKITVPLIKKIVAESGEDSELLLPL